MQDGSLLPGSPSLMEADVIAQLNELKTRVDDHDAKFIVLEHQTNALAHSLDKRLRLLEIDFNSIKKSLAKIEIQLDEIAPAVRNLIGLMQVWSRLRDSEK